MRLRDLDAHFVNDAIDGGCTMLDDTRVDGAQGVWFQCPLCAVGKEVGEENGRRHAKGAHYIRIFFSNPRGAEVAPPSADHNPRWEMSGTSINDLTLNPSINLNVGENPGCTWHGWVKNGDAT